MDSSGARVTRGPARPRARRAPIRTKLWASWRGLDYEVLLLVPGSPETVRLLASEPTDGLSRSGAGVFAGDVGVDQLEKPRWITTLASHHGDEGAVFGVYPDGHVAFYEIRGEPIVFTYDFLVFDRVREVAVLELENVREEEYPVDLLTLPRP
ncbi:MAG TPA: hypothetical protein VGJ86_22905 [Acidimicrobiales bacterium]